ncbi:copia protein [Tanacetum coccineum]
MFDSIRFPTCSKLSFTTLSLYYALSKVVKKSNDSPIIEDWVSDSEEEDVSQTKTEKKIVKPSIAKIEFVKPKQQKKTTRKTAKASSSVCGRISGGQNNANRYPTTSQHTRPSKLREHKPTHPRSMSREWEMIGGSGVVDVCGGDDGDVVWCGVMMVCRMVVVFGDSGGSVRRHDNEMTSEAEYRQDGRRIVHARWEAGRVVARAVPVVLVKGLEELTRREWREYRLQGFEDPDFPNRVYKVEKATVCITSSLELGMKLVNYIVRQCVSKRKIYRPYSSKDTKKFRFTEVKTASTPIETQKPLLKDKNGEEVDVHMYRSMIGSLMYLTSSRPDIMFAVLKKATKLGFSIKASPFDLVAYTDSDYAGASLDRKSTTGGCQFLVVPLISWQYKKLNSG